MMHRRSSLLLLAALLPLAAGCGRSKDPVLAKVGPYEITASEYREAYLGMKSEDRPALTTADEKREFLSDLVSKKVMEHIAFQKYPELIPQQQWRLHRFRERELSDAAKRRLIRQEVRVTDDMRARAYENMGRERSLRAMLILDPDAAAWVRGQLDEGADFAALARDHSAQWVGAADAGNLGWKQVGTFPFPIEVQVWDAEVGSTLGPLPSAMGNYIVQVLDERTVAVSGTLEELSPLLTQKLTEPLYIDRQKAAQDSLRNAADPYYPAKGKAILNLKYYWEPPPEQADNPFAALDADRPVPTFSAEEETVLAVDFKNAPDWKLPEFAERLSWYPVGMWPRGQSEDQLVESLDLVVRDYLWLKAGVDLGFENEEFARKLENMQAQMRVNYYYYNDVTPEYTPDEGEIEAYFQANRDRYQAPESYKLTFFGSRNRSVLEELVRDWKAGATFNELRAKYEKRDAEILAIGETEWLFSGQDALRDDMVAGLKDGEITDVVMRNDVAMAFQLIAKRPPRLLSYGEIKDQVDEDAKTVLIDQKLTAMLDEEAGKLGVKLYEKALAKVEMPAAEATAPSAGAP